MNDLHDEIRRFEQRFPQYAIAYGGDGTVLECIEKTAGRKAVFPFRNYALCSKHMHRLEDFLSGKDG